MLNKSAVMRLFAAGAVIIWCLMFMRCDTTDKSMVRAIMLQKSADGWQVGFLYQAPEASADASDAAAGIAFCSAGGQTFDLALAAAENALPQAANYRLCDYILLPSGSGASQTLAEYEQTLLKLKCGRLSARVLRCGFTGAELSSASESTEALPEKLLQCVKLAAACAPRLYERDAGLLLPAVSLTDGSFTAETEGFFVCSERELALTANQTQAALLLAGESGVRSFCIGGRVYEFERVVCSVTPTGQGSAVLRVDCQPKAGTQAPESEQIKELEALLTSTARLLWENGADFIGLRAALSLRYGGASVPIPAKNACPLLRADVYVYDIF